MIGKKITHYRIDSELGRGGMGVVYRAHDETLRRDVALKILSDDDAGEGQTRILAEARAASALNHPAIVTVYDVGEVDGKLFIVMELLAGQTLRTRLEREGPTEPRVATRLIAQAAGALEEAHGRGIIHGDVKPENMIITGDGRLKLLDFGLARQFSVDCATMTRSIRDRTAPAAAVAGTVAYMAPEQLLGQRVDTRADLYSLGVVLYELAAGRRPFLARTAPELVNQILNETPVRISESGRIIVPAELSRITHKLLEKQPESRYQTARELQVDLNNLIRDLEIGPSLSAHISGKRVVAVLPFRLLTASAEDEYLSVALADAVINQLGTGSDLLVRPTSVVLRYAKEQVDPLLVARELNVQILVDGSIQKFGSKLRIHVQAWDVASGSTLHTAKFDSELADLFLLQDQLAESLARGLGVRLSSSPSEETEPPTKDPVGYQLYLRAIERLSRLNRWDTRTAIEMLEEALQRDPRFSDAWARLADAYLTMAVSFEPKPIWMRQAERAARRALALDPENAAAHCSRGRILWSPAKGFQHRPAVKEFDQALRFHSGHCHAHLWRCIVFTHVGLHDAARADGLAAIAANPDDAMTLFSVAHAEWYRHEFQSSLEYFDRAIAADPSHLWAHLFTPALLIYAGNFPLAEQKLRAARQLAGNDPMVESTEALLWARRGETRKATQMARRAMRHRGILTYSHHAWHNVAATLAQVGKADEAVTVLRKTAKTGLPDYPLFRDDPFLAPLRDQPGFLRLMGELKRTWDAHRRDFARVQS